MFKLINDRVIKTAIAPTLVYFFSDYFDIKYGLTACMISIISIQEKKTDSLKIAFERFLAVFLGMGIFIVLIYLLGFKCIVVTIFILIFMPLCIKLDLMAGFMVCVVMSTHILSEKSIEPRFILNEVYLLFLGLTIGNILNLYIPKKSKEVENLKEETNKILKYILKDLAEFLRNNSVSIYQEKNFKNLKEILKKGKKYAILDYENSIFEKCDKNMNFFTKRKMQYGILKRIRMNFNRIHLTHDYKIIISNFIKQLSEDIFIDEKISVLRIELDKLKWLFSKLELPKTREEFADRAVLYLILDEMNELLNVENGEEENNE